MTTITADYRALNAELHRTRKDFGRRGGRHAHRVLKLLRNKTFNASSVLDYGAGKGGLKAALPEVDVREYDPAIPGKDTVPEPADIVVCTDVLEHIEPDCLDNVLRDLARLTLKVGHVVVATQPDHTKLLPDGRNPHLIVQPAGWWREKLRPYFRVRQDGKCSKNVTFTVFPR